MFRQVSELLIPNTMKPWGCRFSFICIPLFSLFAIHNILVCIQKSSWTTRIDKIFIHWSQVTPNFAFHGELYNADSDSATCILPQVKSIIFQIWNPILEGAFNTQFCSIPFFSYNLSQMTCLLHLKNPMIMVLHELMLVKEPVLTKTPRSRMM